MKEEATVILDRAHEQAIVVLSSVNDKEDYIRENIIPRMDRRRGRTSPIGGQEIIRKIFNVPPNKSGEAYELIAGELQEKGFDLTPLVASEIADIVYYTSQPNCPEHTKDPTPLFDFLGVDIDLARSFCILKYETRLMFGDDKDYKEIENAVLEKFMTSLRLEK
ncbi:MAG: hypothetical protein ACW963_01085 [Candidatus Sifarchaeia archaeon]